MIDLVVLFCLLSFLNGNISLSHLVRFIQELFQLCLNQSEENYDSTQVEDDTSDDDDDLLLLSRNKKSEGLFVGRNSVNFSDTCSTTSSSASASSSSSSVLLLPGCGSTRRVRFNSVCIRNYNVVMVEDSEDVDTKPSGTTTTADAVDDENENDLHTSSLLSRKRKLVQQPQDRIVSVELFERTKCVSFQRKSHTRRKIIGKPVTLSPRQQQLLMQQQSNRGCYNKNHHYHPLDKNKVKKLDAILFPNLQKFDELLAS